MDIATHGYTEIPVKVPQQVYLTIKHRKKPMVELTEILPVQTKGNQTRIGCERQEYSGQFKLIYVFNP